MKIMDVCNLYRELCNNQADITIGELKKKYHLKGRDIVTLLNFLNDIYYKNDTPIICKIYPGPPNRYEGKDLDDELDDDVNNEYGISIDEIDYDSMGAKEYNSYRILIEKNNIKFLKETLELTEESKRNVKFLQATSEVEYVVNKSEFTSYTEAMKNRKVMWTNSILKKSMVQLIRTDGTKHICREKVLPVGLYYLAYIKEYRLIYLLNEKICEVALQDVKKIESVSETMDYEFDLNQYLKNRRQEKLLLKVYKEGNVLAKVAADFRGHDYSIREGEGYSEIEIHVADVFEYEERIKSFGRSVIVLKPEKLKESIHRDTLEALNWYKTHLHQVAE